MKQDEARDVSGQDKAEFAGHLQDLGFSPKSRKKPVKGFKQDLVRMTVYDLNCAGITFAAMGRMRMCEEEQMERTR